VDFFGLTIARTKALQLQQVSGRGGWWPIIRESFLGAWQSNVEVRLTDVLSHPTVFRCIKLISGDIAKNAVKLVSPTPDGIWEEAESPAFSPVLRTPNHYQTRIQFYEQWVTSKLIHGNTYILLQRDARNIVTGMYVLDPCRVKVLVAPDSSVYYELMRDDLSRQPQESVAVPAKEIIHDTYIAPYHPLVGISPIYAAGLPAVQALRIMNNQAVLFANGANPGGVLTAPGFIKQDTADRLKAYWDANFTGANVGKVAVLGDGLKFEQMAMSAVDTDLIKQLNWADERICTAFGVPGYMVGVGPMPSFDKIQNLLLFYHGLVLQELFEKIEALLDRGLGLLPNFGTEFDTDNLLRMDSATMMSTLAVGTGAGLLKIDEARKRLNYGTVDGGDTPYLQQQNFSLTALAERDRNKPFAKADSGTQPTAATPVITDGKEMDVEAIDIAAHAGPMLEKALAELRAA